MEALGWNDRAPAYADSAKATSGYMGVKRRSAQAGRPAGFPDRIRNFRGSVLGGWHRLISLSVERDGPTQRMQRIAG